MPSIAYRLYFSAWLWEGYVTLVMGFHTHRIRASGEIPISLSAVMLFSMVRGDAELPTEWNRGLMFRVERNVNKLEDLWNPRSCAKWLFTDGSSINISQKAQSTNRAHFSLIAGSQVSLISVWAFVQEVLSLWLFPHGFGTPLVSYNTPTTTTTLGSLCWDTFVFFRSQLLPRMEETVCTSGGNHWKGAEGLAVFEWFCISPAR